MSAYNRIGADWCGGNKALITNLLRDEWGFDGFVITDASIDLTGEGYLDPALAVYARNSGILTMLRQNPEPSYIQLKQFCFQSQIL